MSILDDSEWSICLLIGTVGEVRGDLSMGVSIGVLRVVVCSGWLKPSI